MIFPTGATSQSIDVQVVDDSGLPVTGLVAATFPTLNYSLAGANADVAFPALSDLSTITTAYSSGGVKERVNGYYRLDCPNGMFTTAGQVRVMGEATGKHVLVAPIDVGISGITLAATQSGVTIPTVTTVTNQLTAAAIATGVWQDTTSGDFTVASSIGKSLYTSGVVPGGSGGLFIAGSNAATTVNITGTLSTVTTVTNQLTAAAIATGVWQDTTAGDFTVASSIGKSLYTSGAVPGASTGLAIVGSAMTLAASQHVIVDSGTVTTVTNQLTAAQIATGVWQDATAGDFTAASSIGKSLYTSGNAPGAASGIALVGSNMGSASSVTAAVAITSNIKKNQALSHFEFLVTDSTNHNPATGKTLTVTRSIDGGAFAAGTLANVVEVGNGIYAVDFLAADLNGNVITLRATASGCDDVLERIVTQP